MALNSGSPVEVVSDTGLSTVDPELPMLVTMTHHDFPGWAFTVAITPGGTPGGLQVGPWGAGQRPTPDPESMGGPRHLQRWAEQLRVWRMPADAPALTTRLLRRVPLGELQAVALAHWRQTQTFHQTMAAHPAVSTPRSFASALSERPGRRGRSDLDYARLALAYVDSLAQGERVEDLASRLHLSRSTVSNQLMEARRRRLLTPTQRGRPGGQLTDRARDLLEQKD